MRLQAIVLLSAALILSSCVSYDFSRRVVEQGNLIPHDKIERLHKGMSKDDVAILMGTSLLSPTFNNDRWDYVYTIQKNGGKPQVKNLSLYFNRGVLVQIK